MKRWLSSRTLSGGFTLLELLVVVGLIAVVSGIVVAVLNQARQRADMAAAAQFEQSIGKALLADFDSPVIGVWDMGINAAGGSVVLDTASGNNLSVLGNASWDTVDTPLESGAAISCPTDNINCLFINGRKLKNLPELGAANRPNVTLMTWFKIDALPSAQYIRVIQFGPNYIFARVMPSGQLWVLAGTDPGFAAIDLRYDTIKPGRWYHLAISYDGVSARLFVNGRLEAVDENVASVTFAPLTSHVYVGQGQAYGSNMKVWNPRVFKSTAFLGQ